MGSWVHFWVLLQTDGFITVSPLIFFMSGETLVKHDFNTFDAGYYLQTLKTNVFNYHLASHSKKGYISKYPIQK